MTTVRICVMPSTIVRARTATVMGAAVVRATAVLSIDGRAEKHQTKGQQQGIPSHVCHSFSCPIKLRVRRKAMKTLRSPERLQKHPRFEAQRSVVTPRGHFGAGANFAASKVASPFVNASIFVPFGIVMSWPCMNKKNGAAGHTTRLVATIPAVIAAV